MEKKIVNTFAIVKEQLCDEADRTAVEELINKFSRKFKIDWDKDVNVVVNIQHKEIGNNFHSMITVKLKDTTIEEIDLEQGVIPFMAAVDTSTGEYEAVKKK